MDGCWYSDPLASLPRPATCPCDYCKGRREGKTLQADNAPSSADSARRRPNVIASLRRLLAEATPAPWTNQGYDKHEEGWCLLGGGVPFSAEEHMVAYTPGFSPRAAEDAALMCELRNRAATEAAAAPATCPSTFTRSRAGQPRVR